MRIRLVHAHNPGPWTGAGNNTYLVLGARPALIDAGSGEGRHLDDLAAALAAAGDEPGGHGALEHVLVTHAHSDHAAGAAAISSRWPGATFAKFPWPERDARYSVTWTAIADGDALPAGDGVLRAVHTPGHSPDHLCFFDAHSGVLFGGDLLVNGGTVVIPASAGGSVAQYLTSLGRVLELHPRRVLPAHGTPIEHPVPLVKSYIAHRMMRERQVLDALAHGPATVEALVQRLYAGLKPGVERAAAESVLAHLQKLDAEARAAAEPGDDGTVRWRAVPGAD
jgi:glyoxylase-like metal-dependent hydrolase (beta-lactamase superfamily II)